MPQKYFTKYHIETWTPSSAPSGNTGTLHIASFPYFQSSNSPNLSPLQAFLHTVSSCLTRVATLNSVLGLSLKLLFSFSVPRLEARVSLRSREVWTLLWIMCCEQDTNCVICLLFLLAHDVISIWNCYRGESTVTYCWLCYLKAQHKYYALYVFS